MLMQLSCLWAGQRKKSESLMGVKPTIDLLSHQRYHVYETRGEVNFDYSIHLYASYSQFALSTCKKKHNSISLSNECNLCTLA